MTGRAPGRGGDSAPGQSRGGDAQAIGDILRILLKDANMSPRRRKAGVAEAWAAAVGSELAAETRPSTLQKGVLTVEVRSPALLHEFQGFRTEELLGRLLEHDTTGRISGLRFRLGVF